MKAMTPLSPIDYVFTGAGAHPITFAFAYGGPLDRERLQDSLERTVEQFPLLCSRLVRISDHAYGFQVADGVVCVEESSSAEALETQNLSLFIAPVRSAEGEPLARMRLTHTPRGSVLGVSVSHALADGYSYFHFLSSWARVLQGERILAPAHERDAFELSAQASVTPDDVLARCGLFWREHRREPRGGSIREEQICLSEADVERLVADAQRGRDARFFDNDVLTAWLWQRCVPQWQSDQDDAAFYATCPVDFRRLVREVPRTYFGCALCFATASLDREAFERASLGDLALLVQRAVGQVKGDYVCKALGTLEALRREHGVAAMEAIHVGHPHNGIVVTNISRLPIRALDFGAGIPTGFQAYAEMPRGAVILPAEDGVEIRVFHPDLT